MIDTRHLTVLGCGSSSVAINYRGSRIQIKPAVIGALQSVQHPVQDHQVEQLAVEEL